MARTKVKGLDALYGAIRDIPDFPKPGILFRDITPLLKEPKLLKRVIREMAEPFEKRPVDSVLAIESRGFIGVAGIGVSPFTKHIALSAISQFTTIARQIPRLCHSQNMFLLSSNFLMAQI